MTHLLGSIALGALAAHNPFPADWPDAQRHLARLSLAAVILVAKIALNPAAAGSSLLLGAICLIPIWRDHEA